MFYRELNKEQVKNIYNSRMKRDFHPNELKPLSALYELMDKGCYVPMGAFEEECTRLADNAAAYFFFVRSADKAVYLLDYFAVDGSKRGSGIGSQIIKYICQDKKGFLGEVEDVDFAENEEDRKIREKRRAFYLRCGLKETGLRCRLFGSDYVIMYGDTDTISDEEAYNSIERVYHTMFTDEVYKNNVYLRFKGEE